MSRIRSAAAVLVVAAGLLAGPGAAIAASAKPAESVYTTSSMTRCFERGGLSNPGCVHFQAYSTYSANQIWINGHVSCSWSGDVPSDITWCGVGGGNGTAYLNIGLNWNVPDWGASGLYERMNIVAGGRGCTTSGTNSKVGEIGTWYNESLVCEASA
jgi:hypothetical protein